MARLFKRPGSPYWQFDFRFRKQRFQGTTHLRNKEAAESYVAKFRTDLALGLIGLGHREPPPILSVFLKGVFLDHVRQNAKKPRTRQFYEEKVKQLCEYVPFTQLRLDRIDEQVAAGYKEFRLAKKLPMRFDKTEAFTIEASPHVMTCPEMTAEAAERRLSPATINGEIRTLRKALLFADSLGLIRYKRIHALPGETNRTFILDAETEKRYLELAPYPLKQVAILMLDLGLRPEETVSLRKSDISDQVSIRAGKTINAQRSLPQTARTRKVFDLLAALFPDSEWVFPGSKGQHYGRKSVDNIHTALRKAHGFPKEFVLYSTRHTFATRFAETGAQPWEIQAAMGHSSVLVSSKYIHPTADTIGLAMRRKEAYDRLMRGEEVHEETPEPEKSSTS